jgi:uncharacterized protein (TIGR03382 family)
MKSIGVFTPSARRALLWALSLSVAVLLAAPAFAAPLPAPTVIFADPQPDPTGGVVIAGGVPVPFVSATFSGLLTSTVISGDPSNPYGGLTFTYQISNDALSAHEIDRITLNGYFGFLADGSYQTPVAGLAPTLNDRDATGDVIGFTFLGAPVGSGTLLPGLTSALLVVQTDAPYYVLSTAAIIDGSVTTAPIFAPSMIVPEPATITMAALGLGALALVARRRGKRR